MVVLCDGCKAELDSPFYIVIA